MYDHRLPGWQGSSEVGELNEGDVVSILEVLVPLFSDVPVTQLVRQVTELASEGADHHLSRQTGAEDSH